MEDSETKKAVMEGKKCPYCLKETKYVDSSVIYGRSYGMIYLCKPCDAYVGVHKDTDKALGRLANKELRYWKKEAHKYFDMIWQNGLKKRKSCYAWLSDMLGTKPEETHIGMFDVKQCQDVVFYSKQLLNDNRRLDMDFGAQPVTPHFEI